MSEHLGGAIKKSTDYKPLNFLQGKRLFLLKSPSRDSYSIQLLRQEK